MTPLAVSVCYKQPTAFQEVGMDCPSNDDFDIFGLTQIWLALLKLIAMIYIADKQMVCLLTASVNSQKAHWLAYRPYSFVRASTPTQSR